MQKHKVNKNITSVKTTSEFEAAVVLQPIQEPGAKHDKSQVFDRAACAPSSG